MKKNKRFISLLLTGLLIVETLQGPVLASTAVPELPGTVEENLPVSEEEYDELMTEYPAEAAIPADQYEIPGGGVLSENPYGMTSEVAVPADQYWSTTRDTVAEAPFSFGEDDISEEDYPPSEQGDGGTEESFPTGEEAALEGDTSSGTWEAAEEVDAETDTETSEPEMLPDVDGVPEEQEVLDDSSESDDSAAGAVTDSPIESDETEPVFEGEEQRTDTATEEEMQQAEGVEEDSLSVDNPTEGSTSAETPAQDATVMEMPSEEMETVETPPVQSDDTSDDDTSGSCGLAATYRLEGSTLFIEGIGAVEETPWWRHEDEISNVIIGDWIKSIPYQAFWGYENLASVTFPATLEKIGYGAFQGCTSLRRVDLPEGIHTEGDAFSNCSSLSKMTIHSNSSLGGGDFVGTNLHTFGPDSSYDIHLIYHAGDDMSGMVFGGFSEKNWDTEQWEIVEPGTITDIVFPEGIKEIRAQFPDNPNLTKIEFPETTEKLGARILNGCTGLMETNIHQLTNLKEIGGYAFDRCSSLKSLILPAGVTNIQENAFSGCSSLVKAVLPDRLEEVDYSDSMFEGCTSLVEVNIPDPWEELPSSMFSGCTSLDPDSEAFHWPSSLKKIGYNVFENTSFRTIHIPEGVEHLGYGLFSGNNSLEKVYIPNSLRECDSFTDDYREDNIHGAGPFSGAVKLKNAGPAGKGEDKYNIVLSAECNQIPKGMFAWSGLSEIILPETTTSIGRGAFKWSALRLAVLPESINEIEGEAFSYCRNLKRISLPSSLTQLESYTFEGCEILENVYIPAGVWALGNAVFKGCDALKEIRFRGDAPSMVQNNNTYSGTGGSLYDTTLTAYYPKGNDTWTPDVIDADYGGDVTWKEFDGSIVDDAKERSVTINHAGTAKATFYLYDEYGEPLSQVPFSYVRHGEEYVEEMNDQSIMTDIHGGFQFPTPYLVCGTEKKQVEIWFDQITPLTGETLSTDFQDGLTIKADVFPRNSSESWMIGLDHNLSSKGLGLDSLSLGGGNSAGIVLKTNSNGKKDLELSLTLTAKTQYKLKEKMGGGKGDLIEWSKLISSDSVALETGKTYSTTISDYDPDNSSQRNEVRSFLVLMLFVGSLDSMAGIGGPLLRRAIQYAVDINNENWELFELSEQELSFKLSHSGCVLHLEETADGIQSGESINLFTNSTNVKFYAKVEDDKNDQGNRTYTSGMKSQSSFSAFSSSFYDLLGITGLFGNNSVNDLNTSVSDDDSVSLSFCHFDSGLQEIVGWDEVYRYHHVKAGPEAGRKLIEGNKFLKKVRSGLPLPSMPSSYEAVSEQMAVSPEAISWSDTEKLTNSASWNPGFTFKPKTGNKEKEVEINLGIGLNATHGWSTEVANGSYKNSQVLTQVDSFNSVTEVREETDVNTLDQILGIYIPNIFQEFSSLYNGQEGTLKKGIKHLASSISSSSSNRRACILHVDKNTTASDADSFSESANAAAESEEILYYLPQAAGLESENDGTEAEAEPQIAYTVGDPYEIMIFDDDGSQVDSFDEDIELTLSFTDEELLAAGTDDTEKVAIYRYDEENNLYEPIECSLNGNDVTGEIFVPGAYLLAVAGAPQVHNLRCTMPEQNWQITADIASFSGVSGISLTLDGELLVSEDNYEDYYNPDTGIFCYDDIYEYDLEAGIHTAVLQVTDKQGGQSVPATCTFANEEIILEELSVPKVVLPGEDLTIQGKLRLSDNYKAEDLHPRMVIERAGNKKTADLILDEDGIFSYSVNVGNKTGKWNFQLEVYDRNSGKAVFQNRDGYGDPILYSTSVLREYEYETDDRAKFVVDLKSGTVKSIEGHDMALRIPEKVEGYTIRKIADSALDGWGITEIILPNTVTEIGEKAFAGQQDLEKVTLPKGLQKIGREAFDDCPNLKTLTLSDTLTEIGEKAFGYALFWSDESYQWEQKTISGFTLKGGEKSTAVQAYRQQWEKDAGTDQLVTKIILSKTSASIMKDKTLTLKAEAEPVSAKNKAVTWTSSDTKVATVTSAGLVKGISKGTAVITATAKDGSGVKATCRITVRQPVTKLTLNKTQIAVNKGKTVTLKATAAPTNADNKAVTWKTGNAKIATVTATGVVKGISKGSAVITATAKDGSGVKATCKITVRQPVTKLTLSKTQIAVNKGKTFTLKVTAAPTNADNKAVTWKTSNTKIATVTATGVVKGISKGSAVITATAKDGSGVKATCRITVKQPVTKLTLSKTQITLNKGKTFTLKVTAAPTNADNKAVTWKTSNAKIATVTAAGVVKGISKGSTVITATAKDGSGKKVTCKVTVK